jgi:pimeloyl-ACP methyl ester carboxylesterase
VLYQDAATDGQRALDLFFERCQADEVCQSTYPELQSEFDSLMKKLEERPAAVTIPNPITGNPLKMTVSSTLLANLIFNTLYVPDLVAMLPFNIHQAYAEENYAPLITQAYLIDAGIYYGMFYAVACTEDAPLLHTDSDEHGMFENNLNTFVDVCTAWPHGEPPAVVHDPVLSDVPVLMFSGEADPITPPWHAEQLTGSLHNSLNLIFKGMGHGNSSNECAMRILASFIDRASISGLDTTCVASVEPPPFFVDFSGPQP